jgi:hypothetical protein
MKIINKKVFSYTEYKLALAKMKEYKSYLIG